MAIVQLIRMLSKNNLTTYQMNSPQVFAYESDQFHRIFLEFLIIEERSIQISQFIKVHIKRKPTTTNEKPLQPSPQVCIIIYLPIQNSNLCNDSPCIYSRYALKFSQTLAIHWLHFVQIGSQEYLLIQNFLVLVAQFVMIIKLLDVLSWNVCI